MTRKEFQDAIAVQDACNLSGVVFAFARVMQRICDEADATQQGTEWKNRHPIAVLYASKIASLTGCEFPENFRQAYNQAMNAANMPPGLQTNEISADGRYPFSK